MRGRTRSGQYTRCTWALATRTTRRASPRVASTSRVLGGTYLEVGEGKLTTVGLVGEHTADDVLEHLGRRATVEGTARWLGQVTLFQVVDDLNGAGEIKELPNL